MLVVVVHFTFEHTMHAVVLEQVRERTCVREVVHGHQLHIVALEQEPGGDATNASEAIYGNAKWHVGKDVLDEKIVVITSEEMLLRVVTTANERSAFHVAETLLHTDGLEPRKAIGVDEFQHGQVRLGGL